MKKIFLTLTIIFLQYTNVNAQSTVAVGEYALQTLREDLRLNKFDEFSTNKEEYFSFEFRNAKVSGFKEKEKLRYNAFLDQFEFLRDGYLYKLDRIKDQTLVFDNGDIYKLMAFNFSKKADERYLKVLSGMDQKFTLYKKFAVDTTDALGYNGFNSSDANGKRFSKEEKLLVGVDDNLYSVPSSAKKISELLGVNVEEVVKSQKLNLKKEEDLIKLFNQINK